MNHQNKVILGGLLGNVVEAYDVSVCYFSAAEISLFLLGESKSRPTVMLLLIFIAYLSKPIGAFILGLFSDLYGRKNVLMVSIALMGVSTACIGLIPDYAHVGLLAPALLLSLRIIQSASLGSECLNSVSLLVESGDGKQKGFRGCWSSVGVTSGNLIACLVVAGLHVYTANHPQWTQLWRIPFLAALITTIIGFYIRSKLPESLAYVLYYSNRKKPSRSDILKQSIQFIKQYPFMFHFAFFSSFLTVSSSFFFYLYIPLHALQFAQISSSLIFTSNAVALAFISILVPIFGYISDKKDRLKMMNFGCWGLFVLAYPYMYAINYGTPLLYLLMQLLICIPCACFFSVSSVLLTELFPLQIRCTALSIVYSIAASLAAGVPPLLSDYLTHNTNMPCSPSFIIMFASGIVLVNVWYLIKRHRCGINEYSGCALVEERPVFTVQYN